MSYIQNPHSSFNRSSRVMPFQQTYNPSIPSMPLSHLSQMSQMSQMSQQPDYRSKYYEPPSMVSGQINSLAFRNYSGGQSTGMNNYAYGGNANQNLEEVDLGTLISPILLKAYSVLKDSELKPEILDAIEAKLKEKIAILQKYHKNFNEKMEGLIIKAEQQLAKAKQLKKIKVHDKRSTSANQIKRQAKRTDQNAGQMRTRSKSYVDIMTTTQAQNKKSTGRTTSRAKPNQMMNMNE